MFAVVFLAGKMSDRQGSFHVIVQLPIVNAHLRRVANDENVVFENLENYIDVFCEIVLEFRAGRASLKCLRVFAHFSNGLVSSLTYPLKQNSHIEGFASLALASAFLLRGFFASPPPGVCPALRLADIAVEGGGGREVASPRTCPGL